MDRGRAAPDRVHQEGSAVPTEPADAGPATAPIVSLRRVSKTYDQSRVRALGPVDIDIRSGEFFSVLGPSGSGKTTMLRLIAGFEVPDSGQVFIDGADVTWTRPYHRDVNTVFQNYALFPHMTVAANLAYPLRMRGTEAGEIARRSADLIELVDMQGYEQRLPHQLSGGQRQRVALARALIGRPKVVLLDEPLGALDLRLRQQMQSVLKRLQREVEITFIYVTHDQGEALSMSDRLAVMHAGAIDQIGTPEDVYYRPETRFVAAFIGRSNLVACRIERGAGGWQARAGDVRLALGGEAAPGEATVAIRWEAIELVEDGSVPEAGVHLPATIDSVVFHGDTIELGLAAQGVTLTALVQAKRRLRFAPGQPVTVGIASDDVVVLRD
ncbi:MAG: ABC transporter ATP-binding protein [Alphaproteobacteria bacterium]|nr:ABC transporter ATP-binding protein [Alphaproteobacteria bacterium]